MIKALTIGALFILTFCLTSIFSWGVSSADDFYVIPLVKNPPAPVPGTGQMHCTTETGTSIDCSGTGQDYDYEAGVKWPDPRFEFKLGGYRDRLTGLIWQANANNGPMKWESALGFCNTLVIFDPDAGIVYDDWRLPNIRELHSLVDYGRGLPALPYQHPFTIYDAAYWWTSTTAGDSRSAWTVYFGDGKTADTRKDTADQVHAWCVRGGGL